MKTKRMIAAMIMAVVAGSVSAQGFQPTKTGNKKHDKAVAEMYDRYNTFRKKIIQDYCEFVGDPDRWKSMVAAPGVPMPQEKEIEPMLAPGAEEQTASFFSKLFRRKKKKDDAKEEKPVAEMQKPQEKPQPKPAPLTTDVLPVKEVIPAPAPIPETKPQVEARTFQNFANEYQPFTVFGTECKVRFGKDCKFKLRDLQPETIADAINNFSESQFENMLYDCLQERKNHQLSDWAYYQMLLALTNKFYGPDSNEGALVQAFLYSQSGYKMRLAHDGSHLFMLTATRHFVYNKPFFSLGGDWYFMLDGRNPEKLRICEAAFPKESSLSLQMSAVQQLAMNPVGERTITSIKNPSFSFTIKSNKNYIDFYNTYPASTVNNNFMTRWAMYANTPLEQGIRDQLYPAMKEKLQGKSQLEAVQELLWWLHGSIDLKGEYDTQSANCFLYRYDEEIWGGDRAFFGEETLFYSHCDCEDRSILLSHLVREIVGLDVVLVYYPGHLAMAVNFTDDVAGDYYMHDGRKFVVCDPTYIGCRVGETMPMCKGQETTLILLPKQV